MHKGDVYLLSIPVGKHLIMVNVKPNEKSIKSRNHNTEVPS